jgi:dTDP-4-amino-4,6-dideoxygalactose transaminase
MDELPAMLGGPAVCPDGPPDWPMADLDVRAALEAAWVDGSWGRYHGPRVAALEEELSRFHDVPLVLTCASGTLAGEAALRAAAVRPGDEVILAAYEYEANFLNIHAVGARPVLVDVRPDDCQLDPAGLEAAMSPAVRAIIVSHLHGGLARMRTLRAFADAHRVALIEDAAQATGATIDGRKAGSWGDAGVLSFGGSKLLTAGRGGALLVRDAAARQRAKVWLSRGIQEWAALSELQAAVLLPQSRKLDEKTRHRAAQVRLLRTLIADLPGLRLFDHADPAALPAYYKVGFLYDEAAFGLPRELFVEALRREGVAFDEGFRALHIGRGANRFRTASGLIHAEAAHRRVVKLHHPILSLGPGGVESVALALRKTYRNAHRWPRAERPPTG